MLEFLLPPLIGGIGVAGVMGPLGVFVVWRRMAYFGDALAHSALLGIAVGMLTGLNLVAGVVAVCAAAALLLAFLRRGRNLAEDTLLGILAHGSLALGLIAVSFVDSLRVDLITYLFGDILATTYGDLVWVFGGGAVALAAVTLLWRPLVAVTVHEELARVEGVNVLRTQILFMLLIAGVIALAMKVVGVLLVTSLLVIPAAAARRLARTPEQMAALASATGALAVVLGLGGSALWDLPSGPAIVAAALGLFILSMVAPKQSVGRGVALFS